MKFSITVLCAVALLAGCSGDVPGVNARESSGGRSKTDANDDPSKVVVDRDQMQNRNGLYFLPNKDVPYTGLAASNYENGQKQSEGTFKDGKMAKKVLKKFDESEKALVPKVAVLLSDLADLPYQEKLSEEERESGFDVFFDELACIDCHDIEGEDEGTAPDLTSYGSREWLIAIVSSPEHDRFYGEDNDRMPSFGRDEKLTLEEIEIIADWLRAKPSEASIVK